MTGTFWATSKLCNRTITLFSVLMSLLIFRVFLVPNTLPTWFDQWRDVKMYHFGFHSFFSAAIVVCLLTIMTWALYNPLKSENGSLIGLWLVTGAWLAITVTTIMSSSGDLLLAAREVDFLLGYTSGLAAARLFRRLEVYITFLIAGGVVQSIIAIVYQSKAIHTFVSGTVMRAGGTFDTPSDLYLIPLFILPLAVQRILSSDKTLPSVFYMLCGGSMLTALVLTWERSGFLAVCIGLFWLVRKRITVKKQVIGFTIVLFLICNVFFVRSNGPINNASSMRSIHSRFYLFEAGAMIFTHHMLNGVGVGCLSLPAQVTLHGKTEDVQMLQPYNQCLYWLDEMGIVGGVLIASFFAFIYKTVSNSSSNVATGVAAIWIAVLIASLFNTIFGCDEFSPGNMLIGSLLGITMRLKNDDETNQNQAVYV